MPQFPSSSSASGRWTPKSQRRAKMGDNFPSMNTSSVEALVVAAGGGGGANHGGGGGAGGLLYQLSRPVSAGVNYTITIGAGGSPTQYGGTLGTNGGNSVFGLATALGGGRSGSYNTASGPTSGGSGAGGTGYSSPQCNAGSATQTNSDSMTGYGNAGGSACSRSEWQGGGGGGAGGAGGAASSAGGNGGEGRAYSITGSSVTYAGGGGGCGPYPSGTAGSGGSGGGGAGAVGDSNAGNGSANTGGGGGGTRNTGTAGTGGSGVVIIAYPDTFPAATATTGSPTISTVSRAGYRVYTFTASGSITF